MFKWRSRKKRGLVGLDIGSSSVKAVELSMHAGKVTLVNLAHEALKPDVIVDGQILESEEVSNAIVKVFNDSQITTERVASALGGNFAIFKNLVLPLMSEEELSESIDWHAEEHIPFDIADVMLDFQITKTRDDALEVLLAACKRDQVANLKTTIEMAGKHVSILDFDALALQNCYVFNYEPTDDTLVAVLDIGVTLSSMNIIKGRRSGFIRHSSLGGGLYTDLLQRELGLSHEEAEVVKRSRSREIEIKGAEIKGVVEAISNMLSVEVSMNSFFEALEAEIQRTFDYYRAIQDDGDGNVGKLFLSGGGSKTEGLAEFLSNKLEIPVERLDPFRRITYDEQRVSRESVSDISPEMAVAVGLALRGVDSSPAMTINLLKHDEKKESAASVEKEQSGKVYRFKARNRYGELVSGDRVAKNRKALIHSLRQEGLVLTDSNELLKRLVSFTPRITRKRVSLRELERFTHWFSFMINFGSPLVQSLDVLAADSKNEHFKEVLTTMVTALEEGETLHTAMDRHPDVFDRRYVSMIEAGETGGILDTVLSRLQTLLHRQLMWRRKVKQAILYPLTTLALMLLTFVAFASRTINSGTGATSGHRENLLSRVGSSIGSFLSGAGGLAVLAFILVATISLFLYYKSDRGRRRIDTMLLRAPFFGVFVRMKCFAKFARSFSTLLSTGTPILSSMEITMKEARNTVFKEAIEELYHGVECGHAFAESARSDDVFSQLDRTIIGMGEQIGSIDSTLAKLADFYEEELDVMIADLPFSLVPYFIVLYVLVLGLILFYR